MFDFRAPYRPLMQINSILKDENAKLKSDLEQTKFMLKHTEELNSLLREQLEQISQKSDLEKRIAYLEERLEPKDTTVETDGQLKRYKWYNSTEFTQEELLKKLGTGVLVEVILDPFKDNKWQDPEETEVKTVRVRYISKNVLGKTVLSIGELYYRHWFRII